MMKTNKMVSMVIRIEDMDHIAQVLHSAGYRSVGGVKLEDYLTSTTADENFKCDLTKSPAECPKCSKLLNQPTAAGANEPDLSGAISFLRAMMTPRPGPNPFNPLDNPRHPLFKTLGYAQAEDSLKAAIAILEAHQRGDK